MAITQTEKTRTNTKLGIGAQTPKVTARRAAAVRRASKQTVLSRRIASRATHRFAVKIAARRLTAQIERMQDQLDLLEAQHRSATTNPAQWHSLDELRQKLNR